MRDYKLLFAKGLFAAIGICTFSGTFSVVRECTFLFLEDNRMANKQSPAATIKQILGSGKILFICIMCTIAALAAFGNVLDNHLDFDNIEIFGQEIKLGELIGYEGVELLNLISDAIFIFGIIGMLPKLLVAIAFWLVKIGSKEGDKNTKTALLGFNFFKINFMYKAVTQILGLFVIGLLGIFIIIGTISAGISNPTVILVEIVLLALVIGYFYFFFKYNSNYVSMLIGATQTLRTNVNLVVKSNQVIIFNYIVAIYLIISSFGNGIWGIIAGVCDALCIIFVNRCFANFAEICGYAQPNEAKEIMERVKTDPSLEKTAKALGVARTYSSDPLEQKPPISKFFINSMFGLSVAYIDDPVPYTHPHAETKTIDFTESTDTEQKSSIVSPVYKRRVDITDELTIRFLALFSGDTKIEDARYTVVGERNFCKSSIPISPFTMQVVEDSISEKKLLRIIFKNNSSETVKEIKFNVIPKTNESSALGVYKSVSVECSAQSGECFGGENGLILPDDATCGAVLIAYVEFADGMFRDKVSEEFYFSTNEKVEFDTKLYLSSMNGR